MSHPPSISEEVYRVVQRSPNAPALQSYSAEPVSYLQLWNRASDFAHQARAHSGRIAMSFSRSTDYVAALLGCWIAGKAPVILDPTWPDLRRRKIIQEAKIELILSSQIKEELPPLKPTSQDPNEPAYLIYSSGSTGAPKGITVPHAGLVPMLRQQITAFHISQSTRSLWLHDVAFDATISDIGTAILAGATLCIAPEALKGSPQDFLSFARDFDITHIDIPPALLAILDPANCPECLHSLVIGGSVCPPEVIRKWAAKVHLINVYGPTEATVCTSIVKCSEQWTEPLIGQPIDGIQYRLDPPEEGELIISGPGVALGYLNKPALTTERFLQESGSRSFRTGDLILQRPNGDFVFKGRIDRQFKLQGKLISPEEIETTLLAHPTVQEAHILLREDQISAWVITSQPDKRTLSRHLGLELPTWMIPTHWHFPIETPKLPNGKTDLQALILTETENNHLPTHSHSDSLEEQLCQIFQTLLTLQEISPTDDFFQSGGDSLAAMRFLAATESQGLQLSPDCLYQHRTPRRIARNASTTRGYYERNSNDLNHLANAEKHNLSKLPQPQEKSDRPGTQPTFFLTGSTGFLGSAVLGELLQQSQANVLCLVRGDLKKKTKLVQEKVTAHGYEFQKDRVKFITGDLEQVRFGLPDDQWQELSQKATHIIHCGASTHALADYQELAAANVTGTTTALELQRTARSKGFLYASTLSLFVDARPLPALCQESDTLVENRLVYGGYAQTKWVAEKMVQGLPEAKIIRLGLLVANLRTGYSPDQDSLSRLLTGEDQFPDLQDLPPGASMDFTPVDIAAKTLVNIALQNPSEQIYHLAHTKQLLARDLYRAIEASSYDLQTRALLPSDTHQVHNIFKTTETKLLSHHTQQVTDTTYPSLEHTTLVEFLNRSYHHRNSA